LRSKIYRASRQPLRGCRRAIRYITRITARRALRALVSGVAGGFASIPLAPASRALGTARKRAAAIIPLAKGRVVLLNLDILFYIFIFWRWAGASPIPVRFAFF